jgi:2-polyprenyl-3-methyl-5-hydroxy-6-metoxy-1,4-benzoquinol methylase
MSEIADERFLPSAWVERDRQRLDYFIPNYLVKWLDSSWTICSVGCGSGYDVECLRRIGFDAFGFDPGARTAEFCRRGAAVPFLRRGKAEELPWGKGRFDVVYALEVIEHVGCKDF